MWREVFTGCGALAAVSFPRKLRRIEFDCFGHCDALAELDLSGTKLAKLSYGAFSGAGILRVSLPATLKEFSREVFEATKLEVLDLSACRRAVAYVLDVVDRPAFEVRQLKLHRERFGDLARVLLPGSRVEVLYADIDVDEAASQLGDLDLWGIDKLVVVSPRFEVPLEL